MQTPQAIRYAIHAALVIALFATSAAAQTPGWTPTSVNLSGPRVGATFFSPGVAEKLRDENIDVGWAVSQFGWQFEKKIKTGANGLSALNEWVVLVGGLEQGIAVPSLSWLVGLRTGSGAEFGLGPNVTPAGVALAMAAGVTFSRGALNVPVNVAVVPSRAGVRVSLLTGFNFRN